MSVINRDEKTIHGFGDEWERFDQSCLAPDEHDLLFERYFKIFPWGLLPKDSRGFDMGCGSGRWAKLVAPKVGALHCIDPSSALEIAKRNLSGVKNCTFHSAGVCDSVLPEGSMDFGYSLGVLHHIPDTEKGVHDCVRMLKPGAPFLLYLYYALDNRHIAYRLLWKGSDYLRRLISSLPHSLRYFVSQFLALSVYWPLARLAALMEYFGVSPEKASQYPLGFYRHLSLYTMRTDALDRFGTRLEHRFTKNQILLMMQSAGLVDIKFSVDAPYWCAVGIKA